MFTETIFITVDDDETICIWQIMPTIYNGDFWQADDKDDTKGLISEYVRLSDIKEKYGFTPEKGKRYEVTIEFHSTNKEIAL